MIAGKQDNGTFSVAALYERRGQRRKRLSAVILDEGEAEGSWAANRRYSSTALHKKREEAPQFGVHASAWGKEAGRE